MYSPICELMCSLHHLYPQCAFNAAPTLFFWSNTLNHVWTTTSCGLFKHTMFIHYYIRALLLLSYSHPYMNGWFLRIIYIVSVHSLLHQRCSLVLMCSPICERMFNSHHLYSQCSIITAPVLHSGPHILTHMWTDVLFASSISSVFNYHYTSALLLLLHAQPCVNEYFFRIIHILSVDLL